MEQAVDIKKYLIRFGMIYTIGIVAASLLLGLLEFDGGSGVSIAILVVAAMQTATQFILDNKRVPNKDEKSKLIWLSFLLSVLVSVGLILVVLLVLSGMEGLAEIPQLIAQFNIFVIVIPIVVVSLLHVGLLHLSYGRLATKQFAAMQKKGKI